MGSEPYKTLVTQHSNFCGSGPSRGSAPMSLEQDFAGYMPLLLLNQQRESI